MATTIAEQAPDCPKCGKVLQFDGMGVPCFRCDDCRGLWTTTFFKTDDAPEIPPPTPVDMSADAVVYYDLCDRYPIRMDGEDCQLWIRRHEALRVDNAKLRQKLIQSKRDLIACNLRKQSIAMDAQAQEAERNVKTIDKICGALELAVSDNAKLRKRATELESLVAVLRDEKIALLKHRREADDA